MTTKKTLEINLNIDWVQEMEGLTVEDAIKYMEQAYPKGATLDIEYDYDSKYGKVIVIREETEEEHAKRIQDEINEALKKEQKALERLHREDAMRAKDEARKLVQATNGKLQNAYRELHKHNRHLEDLCNLYLCMLDVQSCGGDVRAVKVCMEQLEFDGAKGETE